MNRLIHIFSLYSLKGKAYSLVLLLVLLSIGSHAQKPDSLSTKPLLIEQAKQAQKPPLFEVLLSTAGFASAWTNNGLYRGINFPDPVFGPWVIPSGEIGGLVQFNPELGKDFNNFLFLRFGVLAYHAIGTFYIIRHLPPYSLNGPFELGYYRTNNLAFPLYLGTQFNMRNTPVFGYLGTEFITAPLWLGNDLESLSGYNNWKNRPLFGTKGIYNLNLKAGLGIQPRKKLLHSMAFFIEQTRWKRHILNIGLEFNFRVFKYE